MKARARAFTLIELLVTLALIGILVAIAYPSYTAYAARSRRSEAQTVLMLAAQYLQRFYAANNTYTGGGWVAGGTNGQGGVVPNRVPADASLPKSYDVIATPSADGRGFTLAAVPAAGGNMANDGCGSLTLTDTGLRGVTGSGASVASCWR